MRTTLCFAAFAAVLMAAVPANAKPDSDISQSLAAFLASCQGYRQDCVTILESDIYFGSEEGDLCPAYDNMTYEDGGKLELRWLEKAAAGSPKFAAGTLGDAESAAEDSLFACKN